VPCAGQKEMKGIKKSLYNADDVIQGFSPELALRLRHEPSP
jgi:hypothetical protein